MKKHFKIYICLLFLILCVRHSSSARLWLKEGASCMDGRNQGTCMFLHECKTKTSSRPVSEYPVCSVVRRRKIICCANKNNETSTGNYSGQQVIDPLTKRVLRKTGQKAWDKCLDYLSFVNYPCKKINRMNHVSAGLDNIWEKHWDESNYKNKTISGGYEAQRNQYPHMALLGYGDEKIFITWMCGGSLISERFILTAGHCIGHADFGPVKHIGLGILKRNDPPSMWQRHRVQRIIAHPDYHAPIKYNDIALLKTVRRVTFGPNVAPACLAIPRPPQGHSTFVRESVFATGWGFLGPNKKLAENLQAVDLQEFNYRDCANIYKVNRHMPQGYNLSTQVCYGDNTKVKDTCQGDSGGPLQIFGQASYCQYSIIAITSFGKSCPSEAGMYTRVRPFLPWIESIVWP